VGERSLVTAKVYALRLKTHEWTEADSEDTILHCIQLCPAIAPDIGSAVERSYQCVIGEKMEPQ
jgi:hypothetical protein